MSTNATRQNAWLNEFLLKCKLDDKEALFSILSKNQGTFTYTSGLSEEDKKLPLIGGFMGLIMEGLRRIDENEEDVGDE